MPQLKGRLAPAFVAISLAVAALYAPPDVFALSTDPGVTVPAPPPPTVPGPPAGSIRIGLNQAQTVVDVSAPGGLYILGDGVFQRQSAPNEPVRLLLSAGKVQIQSVTQPFAKVRLVPVVPAPGTGGGTTPTPPPATPPPAPVNFVRYKGRTYRGEMEIMAVGTGLNAVNVIDLEEYLLGVVPREVYASWPIEAVKAQAVAARTYAETHRLGWSDQGFDMVDNTGDQEYGGLGGEDPNSNAAVWATRGQVVKYGTGLANTMYHSSSGGHTESNQYVYNVGRASPIPYLQGVVDYDNVPGNTNYRWSADFDMKQLNDRFGAQVGTVSGVAAAGTLGASGRPTQWKITGTLGELLLTGLNFRTKLGLLSAPRTVTVRPGGTGNVTRDWAATEVVSVVGAGGITQARPVQGSFAVGAGGAPVALGATTVTAAGGDIVSKLGGITVDGGGYGHAVGMSQWGAYGMATQGNTYVQILTHYYSNTRVETR